MMVRLFDSMIESLQVDQLTLVEADEALFYIDLHLDQDGDIREVIELINLKSKILQHITHLGKISPSFD